MNTVRSFRCGALHCGDQVNAIDQKPFDNMSLLEANAILRSCTGDFCRVEVTPSNIIADQTIDGQLAPPISRSVLNESTRQAFYRTPSNNPLLNGSHNWSMRNSYQNLPKKTMTKTRHNSISKASFRAPVPFASLRVVVHRCRDSSPRISSISRSQVTG